MSVFGFLFISFKECQAHISANTDKEQQGISQYNGVLSGQT